MNMSKRAPMRGYCVNRERVKSDTHFKRKAGTAGWNGKITVSVDRGGESERDKGG
jgi:hypothetical protein